jgi:heme ABC exporter ATP-binding subunit CcmA
MSLEPVIRVIDVRKVFGLLPVLDGVSLEVRGGEAVALLGANGAGKTTLLKILATLLRPTRGTATIAGHDVARAPEAVRPLLGVVAHGAWVYDDLTARENLRFWSTLNGLDTGPDDVAGALGGVGLERVADARVRTFSAGMKRRLSLARVMLTRPRVLLLDEPFAGLDATTRADLVADLRAALHRSTAAVLLVTHDRDEAAALAQRTALLVHGRIRQLGTTAHVLDSPADLECATLLGYTTHLLPGVTGRDVLLVARPERCRLLLPGDAPHRIGPAVVVPGTLRRTVPLGGTTRVDVDTAAGPIAVLTTAEVTAVPGDELCVTVEVRNTREVGRGADPQVQ